MVTSAMSIMAEAESTRMNGIAYSAPPRMSVERDGESRRTTVRAGSVDSATILKLSREVLDQLLDS